jgi:hypothetical protein
MQIQILHHGNCFDGVVSAAILTRFFAAGPYRGSGAQLTHRGMAHGPRDPYGDDHAAVFFADVNAVVDFRYSSSPRLDWWCDHHQTAFLSPSDRAHFEADRSGRKRFDPAAPSCAGLLARWLAAEHGLDVAPLADHVRWAELIDSASFESPAQAVELVEPALQLMALLESAPAEDSGPRAADGAAERPNLSALLVRELAQASIAEVHALPAVRAALAPVLARQRATLELMRARLRVERGLGSFDLSADGTESFNKFIPYYLEPTLDYTVGLTLSPRRSKVSVGSNPWRRPQPLVNLGELCARYGGGGHAAVGAVTLPATERETARRAFEEICETLRARVASPRG